MLNSKELNKKYVGKEVIFENDKKGCIAGVTSYEISVTTGSSIWIVYRTGTAEKDNAVANDHIKFVDEALKKEFIEDYEEYGIPKRGA